MSNINSKMNIRDNNSILDSMSNNQTETTVKFLYPEEHRENFGIFRMITPQYEPKLHTIDYILNIDRSGSTMDQCPDGKTKMEHMHFTINNMINYFLKLQKETTIKQYITILAFDHDVKIACHRAEINESFKTDQLPSILYDIYPRGSTNIELALTEAKKIISTINAENLMSDKKNQISHIFMSDGHITAGSFDMWHLLQCIHTENCVNAFIGYGVEHDAKLMKELSHVEKGEYYFIESLENAGMVYGEILYNSIYEYLQNITISIVNGKIYDYHTNTWTTKLDLASLASGQTRTWHIMNDDRVKDMKIYCVFNTLDNTSHGICDSITNFSFPTVTKSCAFDKEVKKYWWRQQTQEKMFQVTKLIEKINSHKSIPRIPSLTKTSSHNKINNVLSPLPTTSLPTTSLPTTSLPTTSLPTTSLPRPTLVAPSPSPSPPPTLKLSIPTSPDNIVNALDSPPVLYPGAKITLNRPKLLHNNKVGKVHEDREKEQTMKDLEEFMSEMKKYMNENNLHDDKFMMNLCDDIYICIKGLCSTKGYMYITTRSVSQGRERAYNVRNLDDLHAHSDSALYQKNCFRSLSTHSVSANNFTTYASRGATDIMRQVSGC